MLKITIGHSKIDITTADKRRVIVLPAYIDRDGVLVRLNNCKGLGDIDNVEIVIAPPVGKSCVDARLDITKALASGIVRFLNRYQDVQDMSFDCYSFACLVHGLPQHAKALALSCWHLTSTRSSPEVGQAVFLMSDIDPRNMVFKHAAIYLGRGLFISVYGAGGQLEVTTLRDMIRNFKADEILLATPRR